MKPANEIDEEAIEWAIKLESRAGEIAFKADLDAWLAKDPRHAGALLRAEAGLSYVSRARALAPASPAQFKRPLTRRAFALAGGASAVAAGAATVFFMATHEERYDTRLGEVRSVKLPDGSTATINTDSDVLVSMNDGMRKLTLAKGEAWFKVTKDARRPFVVEAGDVRVRAVGTAFSVRRRSGGADVVVTEGVVEVWTIGREASRARVVAGNKAFLSGSETPALVPVAGSVEDVLAWRSGQIDLHGETLEAAAEEFNRYNARKIVIADQGLATQKVVGRFSADEPETFVRAVAGAVGARVSSDGGSLRLYRAATQ